MGFAYNPGLSNFTIDGEPVAEVESFSMTSQTYTGAHGLIRFTVDGQEYTAPVLTWSIEELLSYFDWASRTQRILKLRFEWQGKNPISGDVVDVLLCSRGDGSNDVSLRAYVFTTELKMLEWGCVGDLECDCTASEILPATQAPDIPPIPWKPKPKPPEPPKPKEEKPSDLPKPLLIGGRRQIE